MPPPFESKDYWSKRFATETEFEWLAEPEQLETTILEVLQKLQGNQSVHRTLGLSNRSDATAIKADRKLNVLHIGCGSSKLIFHLLQNPCIQKSLGEGTVVNVDYTAEAIELGQTEEIKFWHELKREGTKVNPLSMRWMTADLLNGDDIRYLAEVAGEDGNGFFDLILDKGTCDAICCGPDLKFETPHSVRAHDLTAKMRGIDLPDGNREVKHPPNPARRSPLDLLAFNLAVITRPGALWVVVSYSAERFSSFEDQSPKQEIEHSPCGDHSNWQSFDPGILWNVVRKAEIDPGSAEVEESPTIVHRPKVTHSLYLLRRTDMQAFPKHLPLKRYSQ